MKHNMLIFILLFFVSGFMFAQETGNATYYSSKLKGRKTTDGTPYHPDSMTCAHKTYPLGSYLMVVNPANNERVVVKVTDRGPFNKHLMIDLSYVAATKLDIVRKGIAKVQIIKLEKPYEALLFLPLKKRYISIPKIHTDSLFLLQLPAYK